MCLEAVCTTCQGGFQLQLTESKAAEASVCCSDPLSTVSFSSSLVTSLHSFFFLHSTCLLSFSLSFKSPLPSFCILFYIFTPLLILSHPWVSKWESELHFNFWLPICKQFVLSKIIYLYIFFFLLWMIFNLILFHCCLPALCKCIKPLLQRVKLSSYLLTVLWVFWRFFQNKNKNI